VERNETYYGKKIKKIRGNKKMVKDLNINYDEMDLSVLKRIALNIIKLVQCFYNISLKLIRFKISMNTEEELERIFKTINTTQIKSMLENQA
jgi:hypothetical protein